MHIIRCVNGAATTKPENARNNVPSQSVHAQLGLLRTSGNAMLQLHAITGTLGSVPSLLGLARDLASLAARNWHSVLPSIVCVWLTSRMLFPMCCFSTEGDLLTCNAMPCCFCACLSLRNKGTRVSTMIVRRGAVTSSTTL